MGRRETRDTQARCLRDDFAEGPHRGAATVLEDEVVQAALETVPRGAHRARLDHGLDDEVPVPDDRVRDEDRPDERVQRAEAQSRPAPGQERPSDFGDRRGQGPQQEAPEDNPEHPAARGLAHLPVRTHEEGDRGEHPRAEHDCEVAEGGRDVGIRPEGVR